MKISSIQNYNQDFKALRIKQGADKYIATLPVKVSSKIDIVTAKLANTEFCHLEIGKDQFYITDENKEKLYQPYNIAKAGKVLLIKARQGLTQVSKKLYYKSANEVNAIENRIKKSTTQFERAAEIVKILDEYIIRKKL